jgi:transcriptional regulator with XRE-family HTH domain
LLEDIARCRILSAVPFREQIGLGAASTDRLIDSSRVVPTKEQFGVLLRMGLHTFTNWKEVRMIIGDRLRELREGKKLSQGDIEKRTGLLRCYISRVENGHTIPAIQTLEKLARALEVPLYQLFYEGEEPPKLPDLLKRKRPDDVVWGSSGKQAVYLHKLRKCLSKTEDSDRKILLSLAQKLATGRSRRTEAAG